MPVTTIKHCETVPDYWYTVEDRDRNRQWDHETKALVITYYDDNFPEGQRKLVLPEEDALLIRDAINQLFPPNQS
jgi:hypothetical protein